MQAAAGIDELAEAPVGRYLLGAHTLSFVADERLVGIVAWGRPSAEELLGVVRTHEKLRPMLPVHMALVDVRHLEWPDPMAYRVLVEYLVERGGWLAEAMDRVAVVRSNDSLIGAVTAGLPAVTSVPFGAEMFTDRRAALVWLGRADAEVLDQEIEALVVDASGTPATIRLLREQLDAAPGTHSVHDVARRLGLTVRSLQRRLRASGTTYQAEHGRAQVRMAMRLLEGTDAPLTHVAMDVGCESLSHFSALFRKVTGETPTDWRKRRRR
jgi:AraC-like DNA-binding protein